MTTTKAVAVHSFQARSPSELSFSAHDKLTILEKNARSGWWDARAENGAEGFVPSNYLEEQSNGDEPIAKYPIYVCEARYDAEESNELTIVPGEFSLCSVLFDVKFL